MIYYSREIGKIIVEFYHENMMHIFSNGNRQIMLDNLKIFCDSLAGCDNMIACNRLAIILEEKKLWKPLKIYV